MISSTRRYSNFASQIVLYLIEFILASLFMESLGLSLGNGLLNRVVMNKMFFDYPIVILILQMAFTLCVIEIGRLVKTFKLQAYTFQRGKEMFVPSLFYSLSSYLALNSLDGITAPFFPFIHRFYPLVVVLFNCYLVRRQRPSIQTMIVVSMICVGSALSSVFEFNFDPWGILGGLASAGMMAGALVLIDRIQEQHGSALDLIYMNSFNCLCIFLVADLIQDEIRDAFMYLMSSSSGLLFFLLVLQMVVGVFCHAALLYCIENASALNAAVAANCSSAIQVIVAFCFSIYVFYDLMPDFYNIFGIALAVAASSFFFISDSKQSNSPRALGQKS